MYWTNRKQINKAARSVQILDTMWRYLLMRKAGPVRRSLSSHRPQSSLRSLLPSVFQLGHRAHNHAGLCPSVRGWTPPRRARAPLRSAVWRRERLEEKDGNRLLLSRVECDSSVGAQGTPPSQTSHHDWNHKR